MKDLLKRKQEQLFVQEGLLWIFPKTAITREKMGEK